MTSAAISKAQLRASRHERLEHANELIRIISSHGRRFFWSRGRSIWDKAAKKAVFVETNQVARFELRDGRLFYIDDYTQKAIYALGTGYRNKWRGFSHGGTLRALVEDMRDYILEGTPLHPGKIVISQLGKPDLEDNIWGYDADSARAVRAAAYQLPILSQTQQ